LIQGDSKSSFPVENGLYSPQNKGPEPAEVPSIVQTVDSLLQRGVTENASDIHLEPRQTNLRVRLRVDGVLRDISPYPQSIIMPVLSRLKIMAGMDIAEKRLPQDGNIHFEWQGKEINVRVSTIPTIYGEKMVLRLFDPDRVIMPIENLGFNVHNRRRYLEFLKHAYGMILVTGPTGCGKTTTLYSTLQYINNPGKNILTVEDPVEYRLHGVNQVQVNHRIELSFARCLRTVLRQDPNVIMVGEIRDAETAEIATRAAITGHLVFSTLHTGDAPRAITRMLDLGVEPFMLTSSLVGIVSQRLIRLNCTGCLEEYTPSEGENFAYRELFSDSARLPPFYRGKGCPECCYSGFKGRTAIHEVMAVSDTVRRLIRESGDTEKIRRHVVSQGMITLLEDGMQRAEKGITTIQEVMHEAYSAF